MKKVLLLISWQLVVIFALSKDISANALVKSEQPLKSDVATAIGNTQVDDQLIEDINNHSNGSPIDETKLGKKLSIVKTCEL